MADAASLIAATDTVTVLMLFVTLIVGTSAGGLTGFIIALRQSKIDKQRADQDGSLGLREVDVEQFKALFPGGLGDAVEHWREEAKELYVEVDTLRNQNRDQGNQIGTLQQDIIVLEGKLSRAESKIAKLIKELDWDGNDRRTTEY
jgi:predicted  nucleic acid-binding Zn-ribbon protein